MHTLDEAAALLREYDIRSAGNLRFAPGTWPELDPGKTQAKGYRRDDFTDAWARYCPTATTDSHEPEGLETLPPPGVVPFRPSSRPSRPSPPKPDNRTSTD